MIKTKTNMEDREERLEANRLFAKFHNLIKDFGSDLGQEEMASILAKKCALIAVDLRIEDRNNFNSMNEKFTHSIFFLERVKKILEKKN